MFECRATLCMGLCRAVASAGLQKQLKKHQAGLPHDGRFSHVVDPSGSLSNVDCISWRHAAWSNCREMLVSNWDVWFLVTRQI